MKNVAFVHDWLLGMRGGERCLDELLRMYPGADVFTLLYSQPEVSKRISDSAVFPSLLQYLPGVQSYYRYLLPFYPVAMWQLGRQLQREHKKKNYDLVISVSHCAAKNIRVPRGVPHLCYCLSPVRYLWDQFERYFGGRRIEPIVKMLLPLLQAWDVRGALRVTRFVGISEFIRKRISTYYGRDADVVYPPVRTDWITPRVEGEQGSGFLVACALVPYKNVHVIVEAFNELQLPLTIVGSGPEKKALQAAAKGNITFVANLTEAELALKYRQSRAMVFAAEEDFGMTPVEMQAAGRPVIAFGRGGALETVCSEGKKKTGVFFSDLNARSLAIAVQDFLDQESEFTVENCITQAAKFSVVSFEKDFLSAVQKTVSQ